MKKFLVVFVLAVILATGTAFADHPSGLGVGVQGGGGGGWEGGGFGIYNGASLSLKIPSMPVFWAVDLAINDLGMLLGVSGDVYFIDAVLVSDIGLHWYLGVGVGVGIGVYDDLYLNAVGRLPIGLSWQLPLNAGPINALEIYLQAVPSLGITILPGVNFPAGGWPINLGIRLWF